MVVLDVTRRAEPCGLPALELPVACPAVRAGLRWREPPVAAL